MKLIEVAWFTAATIAAALLTWLVHRHVAARGIWDIPNARSSHTVPTPRGAGMAIAATILGGTVILWFAGLLRTLVLMPLIVGSGILAVVGYVDDKRSLSPITRFAWQLFASIICIAALGWLRGGQQDFFAQMPSAIAFLVLVLGVIWNTNLFNFMDGIDGLAGAQAIFMAGASAILVAVADGPVGWGAMFALTAGACAGFLLFNWAPARIFMGDVGSAFLGFWFATLAVALQMEGVLSVWVSMTLATLFIGDATATLLRRLFSGEKWYVAHRTHVYQRLAKHFGHRSVTLGACSINLIVVLPVALLEQQFESLAPWIASSMLIGCVVICWRLGAGKSA